MPLYLVTGDDANGENADRFVRADTPEEAANLVMDYQVENEMSEFVGDVRIFQIPAGALNGEPGVVPWHESDGIEQVLQFIGEDGVPMIKVEIDR
jgi:hypothetical protein